MSRACLGLALVLLLLLPPAWGRSLYQESQWRGLTADQKAFRVGDVLTVQVLETSSASTSADTGTRRGNGLRADLSHGARSVGQAQLQVAGDFDGGGRTQRASRLLATVTVTVQDVLPGGQLRISGTQAIRVNEELQQVAVEGVVRTLDVSDGNVVPSTRVADARITYVGEGDVSERTRRAWWRRLLDAFGL